jgi:fructose/tagatose bisphosphate aldolase
MKWFLGPMSKNIVDTIIEFSIENPKLETHFIPSRRQIEYYGGYVNYWTTADFCVYVKKQNSNILIQRDHGGPGQGNDDDDGYESLKEDCKYMDIIHLDPWKKYSTLEDGIKWTINMLEYCDKLNPNLQYEIGTEESIKCFSVEDLEYIIISLKDDLSLELFNKIKYLVIQCGTGLCEGNNTGTLNKDKLTNMIELSKKYNLIAKEHNGDWVSLEDVEEKRKLGLTHINIAPELAEIETKVILTHIKNNREDYENIYKLCYNSGKWKKWVSDSFIPEENKEALILFSCHYIYATPEFQKIIKKYSNIDLEIKDAIYNKLLELYNIYSMVKSCLFCKSKEFDTLFDKDYLTGLTCNFNERKAKESYFMPFNVLICKICKSATLKYLGNPNIIYKVNHADGFGETKKLWYTSFKDFVIQNDNINGIIEVGAAVDTLGTLILEQKKCKYTIIDPSYSGTNKLITHIPNFIESVDIETLEGNTILMSNVFEHFYQPTKILEKIRDSKNIKYIYLNHPDFEYAIKNNLIIVLNHEHIWYIEHNVLFKLFENYGFYLNRRYDLNDQLIQLEFIRKDKISFNELININSYKNVSNYFNKQIIIVNKLNNILLSNPNLKYYIWPAALYTIPLFVLGLRYELLSGILDNSPNKINKYLTNYNLYCTSLNELIRDDPEDTCIIISGAGNYLKEIDFSNKNMKIIFINDLNDNNF